MERRRGESPPPHRRRSAGTAVWPEHFVEAVASRLAVDAAATAGRLAAAPALATFFQVCPMWQAVSHSEPLWRELAHRIWYRTHRLNPSTTWHDEFIRLHRTGMNLRNRNSTHYRVLPGIPFPDEGCRCLMLSDLHLAAGFSNGFVYLFNLLPDGPHLICTYEPHPHRDRLGPFSRSISGLILLPDRLIYASQDGDIHIVHIQDPSHPIPVAARRAFEGNSVDDGTLVDFHGDCRRWIGLYAGVPGRSWRVWDGGTEQILYIGGSLTDSVSIIGWHLLTDLSGTQVGRVRMADSHTGVACTSSLVQSLDLDDIGHVIGELELPFGAVVNAMDACDGRLVVVDSFGVARLYNTRTMEETCQLAAAGRVGAQGNAVVAGCMNWGYVVLCSSGGTMRVWDSWTGDYLYRFRERVGAAIVVFASDRYVVAWCVDSGLHLWDFGTL